VIIHADMAPKNKIYQVTPEDRNTLEKWVRSHTAAQNIVLRSRIILECDAGKTVDAVAVELGTSTNTVYKWLNRYQADGLKGIRDLPRPGQPRKLS